MDGLLWFLIFGGLFYVMMRYGCGAHGVHGHGDHGSGGGVQIDPVCGMAVEADQGYSKMYEGRLYRFCSRSCLDKFEAEPAKYLTATGSGGGVS